MYYKEGIAMRNTIYLKLIKLILGIVVLIPLNSYGLVPEEAIKLLRDRGISNHLSETGFLSTVKSGDHAAVRLFLDAGINPDAKYQDGTTALMVASRSGSAPVVKALLDHGANAGATNRDGHHGQPAESCGGIIEKRH